MNASKDQARLAWMVAFTLLLSGCAGGPDMLPGGIVQLQPGTSWNGIQAAISGARDTSIFVKGNQVLLTWWQPEGWGFTCFNCAARDTVGLWRFLTGGKALYTNQWSTVQACIDKGGWIKTGADKLPAWFRQALAAGAEGFWVAAQAMAMSWVSILIIPAGEMPEHGGGVQN